MEHFDQFAYVSQDISGNKSVVTKVTSQTYPDGWAKAGVMFRETNNANSKYVDLLVTSYGMYLQYRDTTEELAT